jgi:DNA-binding transcriptional LysR family regulator
MGRGGSYDEWTFIVEGRTRRVRVGGPLTSNQLEAVIDGCLRGLGCGRFYEYQVREHVKRGRLRYVLESFAPPPVPIHVVYPHARLLSARVRSLVDWLVPRLRAELKGVGAPR